MDAELSAAQSLAGALLLALLLAALHLAAPRLRRLPLVPEGSTASFAGGTAVAYVFLHLLPEVAAGNEAVGEALSDVLRPTPLLELGIFAVALVGLTVFYGLERLAQRSGSATPAVPPAGRAQRPGTGKPALQLAEGPRPAEGPSARVYVLHLGAFLVYNALITYTMALRLRTGVLFALLFTLAMGLHFVLTDRSLEEHHPTRFRTRGRWALAAALVAGWALSALFAPTSTLVVAVLTALLAGAVLLNVFKDELPAGRRSSFPWFLTGLVVYSALLALVTAASE